MQKPPRPQPPRRPAPSGIELPAGAWAGIAAAAASVPAAPDAQPDTGPLNWKAELLADHRGPEMPEVFAPEGFENPPGAPPGWIPPSLDGRSVSARPNPLGPGERKLLPRPRRQHEDPPTFLNWAPGLAVPCGEPFLQLLDYVYGPRNEALLQCFAREPLFAYAQTKWKAARKGAPWWLDHAGREGNQELLDHLYDRIAALMGTYYDFAPAPMVHMPKMYPGALGVYMPPHHVMAICGRLLQAPLAEAIDTIVHEQTHAMQYQLMFAELRGEGSVVDVYERSLVRRWLREQAEIREIPYMSRAIEIHAHARGAAATQAMLALGASPRP